MSKKLDQSVFDGAPDWAQWAAVDSRGLAYIFSHPPEISDESGYCFPANSQYKCRHVGSDYDISRWDTSLIWREDETQPTKPAHRTATAIADASLQHIRDRAKTYDKDGTAERSMARTVAVFNQITGHDLNEADGWTFMVLLKMVRQQQAPAYHRDSAEDAFAYMALLAECMEASQ